MNEPSHNQPTPGPMMQPLMQPRSRHRSQPFLPLPTTASTRSRGRAQGAVNVARARAVVAAVVEEVATGAKVVVVAVVDPTVVKVAAAAVVEVPAEELVVLTMALPLPLRVRKQDPTWRRHGMP